MYTADDVLNVMPEDTRAGISFNESDFFQEARVLAMPPVGRGPRAVQVHQEKTHHVAVFVWIFCRKINVHWVNVGVSFGIEVSPGNIYEGNLRSLFRLRIPDVSLGIFLLLPFLFLSQFTSVRGWFLRGG